jgi:hypothetical protein
VKGGEKMGIKLNGCFENVEDKLNNSTFKRVKIKVHALGNNANGSNITQTAFENAKNGIYGIPIVGKYTEDEDIFGNDGDLTSHNQIIKKDSKGNYILSYDTVPLGFVSPNANIEMMEVTEDDGQLKTYIIVDEVILWKRYEATQKIIEWLDNGNIPKVSMEIGDVGGVVTQDNYFQIDSYEYESICALGSSVEPCFPKAEIESYEKKDFNKLYNEMINEFNSLSNQNQSSNDVDINSNKGGVDFMDEKLELLKKYNLEKDSLDFSIDGLSVEELENKLQSMNKSQSDFTLSNGQLEDAIRQVLRSKTVIAHDYWGDAYEQQLFYFRDVKDGMVIVIDNDWSNYYGIPYTTSGDSVTIDFDNKVAYVADWRPKQEGETVASFMKEEIDAVVKYTAEKAQTKFEVDKTNAVKVVQDQLDTLNKEFSTLKTEKERLEQFEKDKLALERKEQEEELFSKFSKLDGDEEYEKIKTEAKNFSIEDLEKELALVYTRKSLKFSKPKEKSTIKIEIDTDKDDKEILYGGLLEKYATK